MGVSVFPVTVLIIIEYRFGHTIKDHLSHAIREHLSEHHAHIRPIAHSIKVDILVLSVYSIRHCNYITDIGGSTDANVTQLEETNLA
jgi:hypothetical protein